VIAKSPLRIDLSCVLDHVISELTAFLRKVYPVFTLFCHDSWENFLNNSYETCSLSFI
jgi:hypothetical protein